MPAATVEASENSDSIVTFYRFIPEARLPIRADRSAGGTLPARAFRYCEPVASASSFGWYLFPAIDFTVIWDGSALIWNYVGTPDWYPLERAQYPGFRTHFAAKAPTGVASFAPPFLTYDSHLHMLQIWSGYFSRTKDNWSVLVRPVVNVSHADHFQGYDALIETDRWFGPLFTNIRLNRPNVPIRFRTDFPFLQIQPLHRDVYSDATLNDFKVIRDLSQLSNTDWMRFQETVVKPNTQQPRPIAPYAIATRKRRKQLIPS
jgi:hypothetical protein